MSKNARFRRSKRDEVYQKTQVLENSIHFSFSGFQAQGVPGQAGHRHHRQLPEQADDSRGRGGRDLRSCFRVQAGLFQQLVRGARHRPREHRLLQGRDPLLCHDNKETLPLGQRGLAQGTIILSIT